VDGTKRSALAFGVIRNKAGVRPSQCLVDIDQQLTTIISEYGPTEIAIEGLFYAQNIRTALTMGQARGAAIIPGARAKLEIFEYAPRRVKQSVVGVGGAAKNQVGFMVRALLGLKETPEPDAADAIAIALTHANSKKENTDRISL
jgi:crossover junction endodeoxyribonuclease RuvC